jgi:8-oxo-dGTP pyrophosphatase MutT (NUDIX family)
MKIVYANQTPPTQWSSAIFLAGPTPRSETNVPSWRPEALKHLERLGYDGVVFVPEDSDGLWQQSYYNQIEWEERCLNLADIIIFWIPRELHKMPGFTTNDEWGSWKVKDPTKLVFGAPDGAPKVRYQHYYATKYNIPTHDTLEATCMAAIKKIGNTENMNRRGGECSVPLHVWRTPSFQAWYKDLTNAGNRLDDAKIEWVFRVGPKQQFLFFWILHVNIYIAAEGRNKKNEVVIARPDISTILLYERKTPVRNSRIVIVKEFRSPVSNASGYVFELAGGSSWKADQDPFTVAVEECHEEVGLQLKSDRFTMRQTRQVAATVLAHKAHLFSAELSASEMDTVAKNAHIVRGVEEDTERTWAIVMTYGELLDSANIDWSMLGIIASVLQE